MQLWEPKQRIERMFRRGLKEISRRIITQIGDSSDPIFIADILETLSHSKEFRKFADGLALKMVTHLFDDIGNTWRQAAMGNGKGRIIYEALQKELRGRTGQLIKEQIQRNAKIIKTLPQDIASDVTDYVARETLNGRRASDIARDIALKFPEQTKARADLIARTEVSKTQSALIESRCRQIGVNWYVWRAVGGLGGDGRTRFSHRQMADVLVAWDNPPAPETLFPVIGKHGRRYRNSLGKYHAGCCPNCRCYAEPVIDLDMFTWPMKIYKNGSIKVINRKEFSKIINKGVDAN